MSRKHYLLLFILLLFTASCGSNPKSLAENHLDLIKSGKVSQANNQYCNIGETLGLHTVSSFKMVNSQEKKRDNFSYTEVTADIETDQYRYKKTDQDGISIPKKEILKQITVEVWKPEDFYEVSVKSTAKLNGLMKSSSALLGSQIKALSAPDREKVSKESLCIFLPYEQFKSD